MMAEFVQQVDENDLYQLWVVKLVDDKGNPDLPVYGILNKKFGVLEMTTTVLANARKFFTLVNEWEMNPSKDDDPTLPDMGEFGGLN